MMRTYSPFLLLCFLGVVACSSTLDVGDDQNDGGAQGPGPAGAKRMFVTSTAYTGNLAAHGHGETVSPENDPGANGADKLCQAAATAGRLGGTWKAWISSHSPDQDPATTAHHALDRIADVAGGWYNVDRTKLLFTNKANLVTMPSQEAWSTADELTIALKDESGRRLERGTLVWTGTTTGGRLASADCLSWTDDQDRNGGSKGTVGVVGKEPSTWTDDSGRGLGAECEHAAHLYCLEQ
ncbi:DUF1554 domain-containing protein [Pendulispora brunnea]|uniref:DUF1554 domain-containing protein n=1 Tax=Pendulispora brunnea TaxID=2905690 RepID=A0ABZ2K215_9BACT